MWESFYDVRNSVQAARQRQKLRFVDRNIASTTDIRLAPISKDCAIYEKPVNS